MSRYPIRVIGFFVVTALSILQPRTAEQKATAGDPRPFPPDTYAIQFLLRGAADRSPNHYLIALVEITSEPACQVPEDNRFCTSGVRIVDLLGAKEIGRAHV